MDPTTTTTNGEHVSVVPPPSYAEAIVPQPHGHQSVTNQNLHPFELSHRFPSGVFVLRNRSSLKVLDVSGARTQAGTPVIAYRPKRPTLVNGDLFHKENNQLFFLDWHGCLCSASSGLRVDVSSSENKLILSKPRPILAKPTRDSHPPVQFKYDPITRTISVIFFHDPTFINSTTTTSNNNNNNNNNNSVDYLLEVEPEKPKASINNSENNVSLIPLEKLTEWFPFGKSINSTMDVQSSSRSRLAVNQQQDVEEAEEEEEEEDLEDMDDSINPAREVRVVSIAPGWREKFPSSGTPEARKWLKRQWDIASIIVQPMDPIVPTTSTSPTTTSSDDPNLLTDIGDTLVDLRDELFRIFKGSSS